MSRIQEVRTDAVVLSVGGLTLFATTWTVNLDSLYLVALFGAASILALAYGLQRGETWYQAGHWIPLAAIALMIAVAPSDSLTELSGFIIIIGVANILFAPLYYRFKKAGEGLLK